MSADDWAAMRRQAAALRSVEHDDEGDPVWRTAVIAEADAWRTEHGYPPLKTEPELHRRARALGLSG